VVIAALDGTALFFLAGLGVYLLVFLASVLFRQEWLGAVAITLMLLIYVACSDYSLAVKVIAYIGLPPVILGPHAGEWLSTRPFKPCGRAPPGSEDE